MLCRQEDEVVRPVVGLAMARVILPEFCFERRCGAVGASASVEERQIGAGNRRGRALDDGLIPRVRLLICRGDLADFCGAAVLL